VVVLVAWQLRGGPLVDAMLGRPSVDQRLIIAASAKDDATLDAALVEGAATTGRDGVGNSALSYAAMTGSMGRVTKLLSAGAAIDSVNHWGYTPLMQAAGNDHAAVVALLLRQGASARHRNQFGQTPLDVARATESQRAVAVLEAYARGRD
jgi:ankyrin repeat protein